MSDVLYHYTSRHHLPLILKSGYLELSESNLREPTSYNLKRIQRGENIPVSEMFHPVVWLTDKKSSQYQGLDGSVLNKHEICITIKKRDHYQKWIHWKKKYEMKSRLIKAFTDRKDYRSWYVTEQTILLNADELLKIENTLTGEVLIDIENGVTACSVKVERPDNVPESYFNKFLQGSDLNIGDTVEFTLETPNKTDEQVYEYDTVIKPRTSTKGGCYVDFPYDIKTEFGKGKLKVHATFDGEPYDGSIVNMGVKNEDGSVCYVIGILKAIRTKIGKQIGDSVRVTIKEKIDSEVENEH
jgi:hypothetical protein